MELLLIRHALPVRVDEAGHGGPADPHLSERGVAQAEALAEFLTAARSGPIDAVWVSPLRRAGETARPLLERLGLSPIVEEGLAEYDRHATSYIPIEELKAAGDPRWNEIPETDRGVPAPCDRRSGPHRRRPPVPAGSGRLPRRRGERLRRGMCWGWPTRCSSCRLTRRSAACWRVPTGYGSIASLNETGHVRHLLQQVPL